MTNPCQGHAAESAWAEHMKEAERLLDEYIRVGRYWMAQNTGDAEMTARAALLAHIQRGAVPEGWQLVPKEPTPEMIFAYLAANDAYWLEKDNLPTTISKWRSGTPQEATIAGYCAMLAAAPDQFRDATKMMAEPAEVPMPDQQINFVGLAKDLCTWFGFAVSPSSEPGADARVDALAEKLRNALRVSRPQAAATEPRTVGWMHSTDPDFRCAEFHANEQRAYPHREQVTLRSAAIAYGDAREAAGYARGLNERNAGDETLAREIDLVMLDDEVTLTPGAFRALSFVRAALRGEVKP